VISRCKYNPIYEFYYKFDDEEEGESVEMKFTSVAGHVLNLEFEEKYSMVNWNTAPYEDLFKGKQNMKI